MSEPAKKEPTSPWVYVGYILLAFLAITLFGSAYVSCSTSFAQGSTVAAHARYEITWTLETIGMTILGIVCLIWIAMSVGKKKGGGGPPAGH